jgi:Protein NO VEIN, C-terminal
VTTRGESWSRAEVEAIIADYFDMLGRELRGEEVNKTDHRRRLMRLLNGRSPGSVERKHQNVSAILIELEFPYISGYKPLRNYQHLLQQAVSGRLLQERDLLELVSTQVDRPAVAPDIEDILAALVPPPEGVRIPVGRKGERRPLFLNHVGPDRTDYLAREARNRSLGRAGEEFALHFERARLRQAGRAQLADKVEQVSATRGDSMGFDILSFEPNGRERMIEVKTTAYAIQTPFYVTSNELGVSREYSEHYHLYRIFGFRSSPRLFTVQGALDEVCSLHPTEYLGCVS